VQTCALPISWRAGVSRVRGRHARVVAVRGGFAPGEHASRRGNFRADDGDRAPVVRRLHPTHRCVDGGNGRRGCAAMTIDLTGGLREDWEYVWAQQPADPEARESVNARIW